MKLLLSLFAALALSVAAFAQEASKEEFSSIDSIMKAVYDVISGPAGQKRDWDRMRLLFQPEARMIAVGKTRTGEVRKRAMTVEEYITANSEFLEKEGFFEKEASRKTEQFGNIAHVFSTYETRHKAEDEKPFMRGINSFQLWNDGKRWWVITVFWQGEDASTQLPAKYTGG